MEAHRVLGVARDASEEQVRRAYKALAMVWHPDRRPQEQETATAKFVEINKASRALLRNLRRRRRSPTTGTTSSSDSPSSSPKKPPAALPKSPTRSSSQFSTRSEAFSFVESEPSSPLSTANSDHRGHVLTHSPLAQDPSPLPAEDPGSPVGSGPPASLKSARNRLKKQSRPPSARTSSDCPDI
ncbi:hypothetical protein BJ912DRAFT_611417 [Pholiota molesta]|nr:hypothetical protein BJ912DRAFT_611417 [Pholiota molesta]